MIIIMHPLVHHKINAYNSSNKHIFSLLTKIHRETDAVNMTGPATAMLCVLSGSSGSGSGSGSSSIVIICVIMLQMSTQGYRHVAFYPPQHQKNSKSH